MPSEGCCATPSVELVFNGILAGLLLEGRIPPGSLIDAGANSGEWTCLMAPLDRTRIVHAIDPLRANVAHVTSHARRCKNVRAAHHGLGARRERVDPGPTDTARAGHQIQQGQLMRRVADGTGSQGAFDVYTVDDLFARNYTGEQLGLAHFDVEGMDMAVVEGARQTILKDRPVFTVELTVHKDAQLTQKFMALLSTLDYDSYLVEEVCGDRVDCRNLINIPRSRTHEFMHSPTLDMATAARKLFKVDAASILQHAYPCCRPGGACCRHPRSCCMKNSVGPWLFQTRGEYFSNFTREQQGKGRTQISAGTPRDPSLFTHVTWWWQHKFRWPGPEPGSKLDATVIYS
jgi:FkbM family methyltransferase